MEDIADLVESFECINSKTDIMETSHRRIRIILYGATANEPLLQPVKKRARRLTSIESDDEHSALVVAASSAVAATSANATLKSADTTASKPAAAANVQKVSSTAVTDVTVSTSTSSEEHVFARPQRAAKLRVEKCLKEPSSKVKLRRPDGNATVKLESEQRRSQREAIVASTSKLSVASTDSSDVSVAIISAKTSIITLSDSLEDEEKENKAQNTTNTNLLAACHSLVIKVKKEKSLIDMLANQTASKEATIVDSTNSTSNTVVVCANSTDHVDNTTAISVSASSSNVTSNTSTANKTKRRGRGKNHMPMPIKVERLSDEATATNKTKKADKQQVKSGESNDKANAKQQQSPVNAEQQIKPMAEDANNSVYEDAMDNLPDNTEQLTAAKANETVTLAKSVEQSNATMVLGAAPADATYINPAQMTFQVAPCQNTFIVDQANNINATITLNKLPDNDKPADTTFNMPATGNQSSTSTKLSMETARDTTSPIVTEKEDVEQIMPAPLKPTALAKSKTTGAIAKAIKLPTRTKELFNPLIESPVKSKVKAFEKAANCAAANQELTKTGRLKRLAKENQNSSTTPIIGKMPVAAPALGRFLTPSAAQGSNITPKAQVGVIKKVASSASKALPIVKGAFGSSKNLTRENSNDDLRKIAEERLKQRELKHAQAALLREAKERERAEHLAKVHKEREEKRLKHQMEVEQKKREMEEAQRKQRLEEKAAAKQKAAACKAERELLQKQQKAGKMLPPAPKVATKYIFEMLQQHDSTDEEEKVTYKRPPVPNWSRKHVRGGHIVMQQYQPMGVIDGFFSIQPLSPDLRLMFPDIDARHLKRNSSAFWTTPPRYSQIPKP